MRVDATQIVTVMAAVLGSLVTVIGAWAKEWSDERSQEARRRNEVDDTVAYMSFLRDYMATAGMVQGERQIEPVRHEVWSEMEVARQQIMNLREALTSDEASGDEKGQRWWTRLRSELLLHRMHSKLGAALRWTAYLWMALAVPFAFSTDPETGERFDLGTVVVGVGFVFLLPALAVGYAARTLERRALRRQELASRHVIDLTRAQADPDARLDTDAFGRASSQGP